MSQLFRCWPLTLLLPRMLFSPQNFMSKPLLPLGLCSGTASSKKPSLLSSDSTAFVLSLDSKPQSVTPFTPLQGFQCTQQVQKQCLCERFKDQQEFRLLDATGFMKAKELTYNARPTHKLLESRRPRGDCSEIKGGCWGLTEDHRVVRRDLLPIEDLPCVATPSYLISKSPI